MWGAYEGMGWWMVFGTISWLVFLGALVFVFSRVFAPRDGTTHGPSHESALDIARRRYASGEISEEEFRRIREQLSQ